MDDLMEGGPTNVRAIALRSAAEAVRDAERSPTAAVPRSPGWHLVREQHVAANPVCVCCGGTRSLEVHHVKPFHLYPELELDRKNLMTLCSDGPGGMSCHRTVGHGGDWNRWNPLARSDAPRVRSILDRCIDTRRPKRGA